MKHVTAITCVRLRPDVLQRYLRMRGVDAEVTSLGHVRASWEDCPRAAELTDHLQELAVLRNWDPKDQRLELYRETDQIRRERRKKELALGMKWPFSYFLRAYNRDVGLV